MSESWLHKRAVGLAAKHLNGLGRRDDAMRVARSLAPGIEALAREFARRALESIYESYPDYEKKTEYIDAAIDDADKP